jgi:putative membrane protein
MTHSAAPHDPRIGHPFRENRFLHGLVLFYALVFAWSAHAPKYPRDWWLEMLLAFAFLAALVATHRRFVFSNFSYALMTLFLALHTYGAHYTYAESAFGDWLKASFALARNPYDRIVHFSFGALLVYPTHELARRVLHLRGRWAYVVPWLAVLALSGGYEIVESWTARIVSPDLGVAYLGIQGDEWDAQKDMSLANTGSLLSLALAAWYQRRHGEEAWKIGA